MADLIPPAAACTLVTLEHGPYALVIDPANGARIIAFTLKGKNCLTINGPQIGSTFWPSPQDFWGWPPPAVLDSEPYQATQVGDAWVFTSEQCPITKMVLSKTISPINKGFSVEYRMYNPIGNTNTITFAPWEITRIDGGITFYKADAAPLQNSNLPIEAKGNVYWHNYTPAGFDNNLKLFANQSHGWLANVCNGLLLKKSFPKIDESLIAPSEAEVEIYAHGDMANPYIEIEQQGAYLPIEPGQSASWEVFWQLEAVCEHTNIEVGSEDLIKLAESFAAP